MATDGGYSWRFCGWGCKNYIYIDTFSNSFVLMLMLMRVCVCLCLCPYLCYVSRLCSRIRVLGRALWCITINTCKHKCTYTKTPANATAGWQLCRSTAPFAMHAWHVVVMLMQLCACMCESLSPERVQALCLCFTGTSTNLCIFILFKFSIKPTILTNTQH